MVAGLGCAAEQWRGLAVSAALECHRPRGQRVHPLTPDGVRRPQVGRVVVQAPEEALLGLWFGLLRGCDDAMAAAMAAGKPAKVPPRASVLLAAEHCPVASAKRSMCLSDAAACAAPGAAP